MLQPHRKGVSLMIGYVLLIVGAIVIGGLVYGWLKTYVPKEAVECPEGVSIFIQDLSCDSQQTEYKFDLSITNNGRFAVNGLYVRVAESDEQKIATTDISDKLSSGGNAQAGVILFTQELEPGQTRQMEFNLNERVYLVEATPIRYEIIENQNKLVTCGNAKVKEKIDCSED